MPEEYEQSGRSEQNTSQDTSQNGDRPAENTHDVAEPQVENDSDRLDVDDVEFDQPRENEGLFDWNDISAATQFTFNFYRASQKQRELFAEVIAFPNATAFDVLREAYPSAGRVESLNFVKRLKDVAQSNNMMQMMQMGVTISRMDHDDVRDLAKLVNALYSRYPQNPEERYGEFRYRKNMDFNVVLERLTSMVLDISDEGFGQIDWMLGQLDIWPGRVQ